MLKTKTKINAVDIFFILLAITILVAMFMRSGYVLNLVLGNNYNVTYTLKLTQIDNELVETVAVGDKVKEKNEKVSLGEIIELDVAKTITTLTTASGSNVVGELVGKSDITLTVNSDVLKNENVYVLGNDVILKEGNSFYVTVGEIYAKATIINVQFGEMTKK